MINPTEKNPEHTKTIFNVRNNSGKPQTDRTNNGAKANKDSVIIVGYSMIKHVNGRDISRSHTVKIRPNPKTLIYSRFNGLRETCHAEKAENPGDPYRYEWPSTGNQYNQDG